MAKDGRSHMAIAHKKAAEPFFLLCQYVWGHFVNSVFNDIDINDLHDWPHLPAIFLDKLSLNFYYLFRRLGISDMNAYELDSSLVTIERIPLTIPTLAKIPTIVPMSAQD